MVIQRTNILSIVINYEVWTLQSECRLHVGHIVDSNNCTTLVRHVAVSKILKLYQISNPKVYVLVLGLLSETPKGHLSGMVEL